MTQTFPMAGTPVSANRPTRALEKVVPCAGLQELIEPYEPKAGNGRPPHSMATMLRIHVLQNGFALIDPQ